MSTGTHYITVAERPHVPVTNGSSPNGSATNLMDEARPRCGCSQCGGALHGRALANRSLADRPLADRGEHELRDEGVGEASQVISDAAIKGLKSGRLPKACAQLMVTYLEKALNAATWDVLDAGEYTWLNQLWRALVHDESEPPVDCHIGPADNVTFDPAAKWNRPPDDPDAPSETPWGWIIAGVGVLGAGALAWYLLERRTQTRHAQRSKRHHHTKKRSS